MWTLASHSFTYLGPDYGGVGIDGGGYHWVTKHGTSGVEHAHIEASTSKLGGLATGNKGSETRPVNMRVIWILKAW